MALEQYQLENFRGAAEQACYEMNENPHETVCMADGRVIPKWVERAQHMAEIAVMIRAMRNAGLPI